MGALDAADADEDLTFAFVAPTEVPGMSPLVDFSSSV
jgi:hypothetical protein